MLRIRAAVPSPAREAAMHHLLNLGTHRQHHPCRVGRLAVSIDRGVNSPL